MTPLTLALASMLLTLALGARLRPENAGRTPPSPPSRPRSSAPPPACATEPIAATASSRGWSAVAQRIPRPVGIAIGAGVVALLVDPFLAAIVVTAIVAWPRLRDGVRRRGELAAVEAAVPDAVELLVLLVHAGLSPHQAVAALAADAPPPIRPGFVAVVDRMERGSALADALAALPERLGPALTTVADTLAIAVRHGTPIADALAQLSIDARQRRRRAAEAAARKLPVRLSFPLVFATLPSFVLVAIAPAIIAALSSLGDSAW